MDMAAKRRSVRRWLDMVRYDYEHLTAVDCASMTSLGLTATYDAIGGGRGNMMSDHTAREAMAQLSLTATQRVKIDRMYVIFDVYGMLLDKMSGGKPKTPNRMIHDRILARILKHKIFDGWTMERIGTEFVPMGKTMSKQHISKKYAEIVEMIIALADARGML